MTRNPAKECPNGNGVAQCGGAVCYGQVRLNWIGRKQVPGAASQPKAIRTGTMVRGLAREVDRNFGQHYVRMRRCNMEPHIALGLFTVPLERKSDRRAACRTLLAE